MTLLQKLLPQRAHETGMPGAGAPEITSQDVALAVSRLDPFEADVLQARHIQKEPGDLERVLQEIQNRIVRAWQRGKGGESLKRRYIRPMAECCWAEFVSSAKYTHLIRADALGLTEVSWHNAGYKHIYDEAFSYLCDTESKAYRKVKAAIGD